MIMHRNFLMQCLYYSSWNHHYFYFIQFLIFAPYSRYYDSKPFDSSVAAFRFNTLMSNLCREKGCRFADPNDDLFDYRKGQLHPFFHSKPAEMHCNVRSFFFWHRALLNAAPDQLQWCHSPSTELASATDGMCEEV